MKRLEEKVKDIVEVRESVNLHDFLADPAKTLEGYHFTDITADLMAKWIGRIAEVRKGHGAASALAGFRGVGKSHYLAALGAIVSQPELRAKISDSHVMAKAQRLSRRHGMVAHLRRGSGDSLLSELKNAVADAFGERSGEMSDSLTELLLHAADKSGETPFVLLIDTAAGRERRVARDDGPMLSEMAKAAVTLGIFVGVALDDDIAGADGMNSSIASSFTIDFLDQEHLYKIVNAHVFAKHEQMRPVLHEIYESYRAALPGFRWSEHRFSSLYPLHPAILEVAPFVRLYLHEFALLGFASDAGVKILGRPANSLIGLDEVFDSVEPRMRLVGDLKEAFAAYDSLDRDVVGKIPVMKRHEAKLILKGLFLLSLNGGGATATEISAAMMIFNEAGSTGAVANVEAVLESFSTTMPGSIRKSESPDREAKFSFKLGAEDDLNSVLAEAIEGVSMDVVDLVLRRQTSEKFGDFVVLDDHESSSMACEVVWRGGIRPGEFNWLIGEAEVSDLDNGTGEWRVFIRSFLSLAAATIEKCQWPICEWKLGELTAEDIDTIRRFHVLQTDQALREKFRESLPTALHAHSIAVEKIWQRVFLENSVLISGESRSVLSDEAISSHSLAQMLSLALAGHFAEQFPLHPHFSQLLGTKEAALVTEHVFSGPKANNPEIQKLATNFALPLGLVRESDGELILLAADELAELSIVKETCAPAELEKRDVIPLDELFIKMRQGPYGLTQEAQRLLLAALAGQRQFEFVTSAGNRINHRSLDLQIIWDDIIGVAKPAAETYSSDRLLNWATRLTGDISVKAIKSPADRSKVIDILSGWLEEWQTAGLVDAFNGLPDEKLNSKLWRIASNVKKSFGVVAESIVSLREDAVTLDQCLQNIADAFSDSEDEFLNKQRDLASFRRFVDRSSEQDEIYLYLALCEPSNDPETEMLRYSLMEALRSNYFGRQEGAETEFRDKWSRFATSFRDFYAERHDLRMVSDDGNSKLDEFLGSDLWSMFSDLSSIPWFGRQDLERAMSMIRELRRLECDADVREMLIAEPSCRCSFRLADSKASDASIDELRYLVTESIDVFRQRLLAQDKSLLASLGAITTSDPDSGTPAVIEELESFLAESKGFPKLSGQHIQILRIATGNLVKSNDRRRLASSAFGALHPHDFRELENELDRL